MTDIVERLRDDAESVEEIGCSSSQGRKVVSTTLRDAAAEITRLRQALMPFAHYFEQNDCDERRDDDALEVPIGDLRRACAALTSTESGGGQS